MSEAFSLHWKLDRPFVEQNRSEDVHALISIEPNAAFVAGTGATLPVHIIVLVDVSASMDYLVRFDPGAKKVGEQLTEGRASQKVISSVPSRREMACNVVKKLAERLNSADLLTVIGFDDSAHVLAEGLRPSDLDAVCKAISDLERVGGGGTSMGKGIEAVRDFLARNPDSERTRRLVILTDGEDQEPAIALRNAHELAKDLNVPIVAFGTGECKVAFLTQVAKTTLAGAFNHIRTEKDAEHLFHQVLSGQKNVQATNAVLNLWLSPEVHVREFYRTRPEILYVGQLQPNRQNVVELRLEQMERGKAYEFLCCCTLPPRPANQRFRIAKATLSYDLPSVNRTAEKMEANIVIEYSADPERLRERSGDVHRVLTRAEVQRQVLFLQEKADLIAQGKATDRDRVIVANLLQALIVKFEGYRDQAMVNQFRNMQQEFERNGTISQEMLNRSLAASSRAEEVIVAQDIDF